MYDDDYTPHLGDGPQVKIRIPCKLWMRQREDESVRLSIHRGMCDCDDGWRYVWTELKLEGTVVVYQD